MTGSSSLPRERLGTRSDPIGWWRGADETDDPEQLIQSIDEALLIVGDGESMRLVRETDGRLVGSEDDGLPIFGRIPAVHPRNLGDAGFCQDLGIDYPYISGAMANGIGSVEIACAMAESGMLGFFGAAGLRPDTVAAAIDEIRDRVGESPFGVNLIHTPHEGGWEEKIVDLLIAKEVRLIEASAYLRLTPAVVRYRLHGIHQDVLGRIVTPNRIIAKVSRVEVASQFLAPPPAKIIDALVEAGQITREQAELAARIPVAQDITAEADSGGHTDNRPAIALLPTLTALRDRLQRTHDYSIPLRVGLAGGIATPASAAAAFAMGAAYVLIGSVHQSCIEAGTSELVRAMLAEAGQADIAMAPAADMFEMGVQLQVLKRGTMFPMRAQRLYELYRANEGLHTLSEKDKNQLEKMFFRCSLDEVWTQTRAYFEERDPANIERAERDPKHKMALVFRWYLGKSSHWANSGATDRKIDFQIWCGPAMGAFNEWVDGSYLAEPEHRRVADVARNILHGAAVTARLEIIRLHGFPVTTAMRRIEPIDPAILKERFR